MEEFMDEQEINFQLTPDGSNQRNIAERVIQAFKNYFISGVCSLPAKFLMYLWDKLLQQAEITLNLLRPFCIHPQLSAYLQLYGAYYYNKTPLAPPGINVQTHIQQDDQK